MRYLICLICAALLLVVGCGETEYRKYSGVIRDLRYRGPRPSTFGTTPEQFFAVSSGVDSCGDSATMQYVPITETEYQKYSIGDYITWVKYERKECGE